MKMKTNRTHDTTPRMVGRYKESPQTIDRIEHEVGQYLNLVIDEAHWSKRLNKFNHNPHFPTL